MVDYLKESYGGAKANILENSAYYCYTIFDKETKKYYSGSRGVEGSSTHDLLTRYFTSSSVTDFKKKLKEKPEMFLYEIEYFQSRADAFVAEKIFHDKFQVGRNKRFYNSLMAGNTKNTNCGAGSVLCRDRNNKIYRVSVDVYAIGEHTHVCANKINIRTENGIEQIPRDEFNPEIHSTQFEDHVLALNTETGKNCRIPKELFESSERYVGITKGMVAVHDNVLKKNCQVPIKVYRENKDRYETWSKNHVIVYDKLTNEKVILFCDQYDKTRYRHSNEKKVTVYSIEDKKHARVTSDEYWQNKSKYARTNVKHFFRLDGILFLSKKDLHNYCLKTRKCILQWDSILEIQKKIQDIEVISREDFENEN
jgi:hypothetical protein